MMMIYTEEPVTIAGYITVQNYVYYGLVLFTPLVKTNMKMNPYFNTVLPASCV